MSRARPLLIAMMLGLAVAAPAPVAAAGRVIAATGQWAAIDRGRQCDAASRSLRIAGKGQVQARAGFAFDRGGPRNGQFYTQLRRPVRPGSTVILKVDGRPYLLVAKQGWAWSRGPAQDQSIMTAVRSARWLRIEARDAGGRRFTEHYSADGAPTAIDSAAAHCALAALAKSR